MLDNLDYKHSLRIVYVILVGIASNRGCTNIPHCYIYTDIASLVANNVVYIHFQTLVKVRMLLTNKSWKSNKYLRGCPLYPHKCRTTYDSKINAYFPHTAILSNAAQVCCNVWLNNIPAQLRGEFVQMQHLQ